jgi:hypothetical protein
VLTYLAEARDGCLAHEARHTVESIRQCMAELAGNAPGETSLDQAESLLIMTAGLAHQFAPP